MSSDSSFSSSSGADDSLWPSSQQRGKALDAQSLIKVKQLYEAITSELSKIYVGQEELVQGTLTALFSGGHVLIESVPGLGKTLFVRTLGRVLGCECGRIQFTADLMPSDITGARSMICRNPLFSFVPVPSSHNSYWQMRLIAHQRRHMPHSWKLCRSIVLQ